VPLLVFIHGGYWRSLDKSDFSYVAPSFTHAGAAVAVINYRLIPKVTLEEQVRDVLMAVTWCYLHAGHYGANPHHLYVTGHSAGGHLAAMMLAAQWPRWHGALPPEVVRGGLCVSGLYDLEPLRHAPFLKGDLGLDEKRAVALSPALMPPATHAPLITAVGGEESDEFKRQGAFLAQQWKGVFMKDVPMPGHDHFSICTDFGNRASPLVKALQALMGMSL
jgi:arylformamidase